MTGSFLKQATNAGTPAQACTVNIALVGATGRIGRQLLHLIDARAGEFRAAGVAPRLVAVANSRTSVVDVRGIPVPSATALLERAAGQSAEPISHWTRHLPRPLVIIDCTASADIASRYPQWLEAGIDIVTPNKLGPSADDALYRAITAAQVAAGTRLRDATTVGAQLPLLSTLRDLRQAGDRVERFEAVLSGTLSYVLSNVQDGEALSTAVRAAVAQGYAEPNPARDLSGEDAARKLVILLRALGHSLELADVECVPLVEAELLEETDAARLLEKLSSVDELWRARSAIAQSRHERWIYRASFENGRARIAPERVALTHPLANLKPCENALILHSRYYSAAPLTISGPGAGVELTAAGVFADLFAALQRRAEEIAFDTSAVEAAA